MGGCFSYPRSGWVRRWSTWGRRVWGSTWWRARLRSRRTRRASAPAGPGCSRSPSTRRSTALRTWSSTGPRAEAAASSWISSATPRRSPPPRTGWTSGRTPTAGTAPSPSPPNGSSTAAPAGPSAPPRRTSWSKKRPCSTGRRTALHPTTTLPGWASGRWGSCSRACPASAATMCTATTSTTGPTMGTAFPARDRPGPPAAGTTGVWCTSG